MRGKSYDGKQGLKNLRKGSFTSNVLWYFKLMSWSSFAKKRTRRTPETIANTVPMIWAPARSSHLWGSQWGRHNIHTVSILLLCIIVELARYLCANEEGSRALYPPPLHLVPSSETGTWKGKKQRNQSEYQRNQEASPYHYLWLNDIIANSHNTAPQSVLMSSEAQRLSHTQSSNWLKCIFPNYSALYFSRLSIW